MRTYEIQQYEIHVATYRIEAECEADAIATLLNGECDDHYVSTEYIEVAQDCGMPADEHQELTEQLRQRGVDVGEFIESIRGISDVSAEYAPDSSTENHEGRP